MEGTDRVLSHMLGKARKGSADNTIQIMEKSHEIMQTLK
jgi:hypothetical protein